MLKRKIDKFLNDWKNNTDRLPLIVKGARQVGKTKSIESFAHTNYKNVIEINFALQKQYKKIFDDGFEVDQILKNISFINPSLKFPKNETLIFFDELQDCPNCATSLKSFKLHGEYDVICSGSMMGINYEEIESNSVGYKQDIEMLPLDFEEFLWAKGYSEDQIEDLYSHMIEIQPLSSLEYDVFLEAFREYMVVGGMPAIVNRFAKSNNYSGTLDMQKQILLDYEEDITKYATGLDKAKVLNVFRSVPVFLGKENKKFQITKVKKNARSRDYVGSIEWLCNAGIINACHCMSQLELPLKGNYDPSNYKVYFADPGLLVGSLDEEAQTDLRTNKNFNTYKGALYENVVACALKSQGYNLYFFKNKKNTMELDFIARDANCLVPIEVKANNNASKSLTKAIKGIDYPDVEYGIKFCNKNIGFNKYVYTFPYFLAIFTKRFLKENKSG